MTQDMHERDYSYSRLFDVHIWSDYSEVNLFVNLIYHDHFSKSRTNNVKKKHLKKVLIDLYVAWVQDPNLNISISMTRDSYSGVEKRYNELNIKATTIPVVHRLNEIGLIGLKIGYPTSDNWVGRLTCIWASPTLIKMFEDARFGEFNIGYSKDREVIILRDTKENGKKEKRYSDTKNTRKMRRVVQQYNELLERTFIDIDLDIPKIIQDPRDSKHNKTDIPYTVNISHHHKFVRRVFSNKSWKQNGRFYGGWWQRINETQREKIRINNMPTVEIDYKALHVVLAYSEKHIDYWKKTSVDPYKIPIRNINDPKVSRQAIKLLFMMAINADNEELAFSAFRNEWNYKKFGGKFDNEVLSEALQTIKKKHPDISDLICTGAGVDLQYIDSQIVEYIVRHFTEFNAPVLTIHDSFIVSYGLEEQLEKLMKQAFYEVTGQDKITIKFNKNVTQEHFRQFNFLPTGIDADYAMKAQLKHVNPDSTNGYKLRWERHQKYYSK